MGLIFRLRTNPGSHGRDRVQGLPHQRKLTQTGLILHVGSRIEGIASPHPRCRVTDTAWPSCHLRSGCAHRQTAGASAPRGVRAPRDPGGENNSVATRRERPGRNQSPRGPRHTSASASGAGRCSLRRARPYTSRFVSMAAKGNARCIVALPGRWCRARPEILSYRIFALSPRKTKQVEFALAIATIGFLAIRVGSRSRTATRLLRCFL